MSSSSLAAPSIGPSVDNGSDTKTLDEWIRTRHSTRNFLPAPVPRKLNDESVELARTAPSNSNVQPWRITFASGPARDRLACALLDVAGKGVPNIPPLPEAYRHFRSELGLQIYGQGLGISRDDKEARASAVLRNFEFFGAPEVCIVCMENTLTNADALSVGMYLQTLLLALTERGLGTCVEVSVAGYPEVVREQVGIGDEMLVLCGVAIGYADETLNVNHLPFTREEVFKNVRFLED